MIEEKPVENPEEKKEEQVWYISPNYKFSVSQFAKDIKEHYDIVKLSFKDSRINSENYKIIENLSYFSKLEILDLTNVECTFSKKAVSLTKNHTSYTTIDLSHLVSLKTLNLSGFKIKKDITIDISNLTNITELNISKGAAKYITGIESLQLTVLNLSNNKFEGLSYISAITTLTKLSLHGAKVAEPDSILPCIQLLINLEYLDISGIPTEDEYIINIKFLTQIRTLGLRNTGIEGSCLKYFAPTKSKTTENHFGKGEYQGASNLLNITALDLSNNKLFPKALEHISTFSYLIKLDLSNTRLSAISYLSGLTQLTFINLSNNELSVQALQYISGLTNLKDLNLNNNRLLNNKISECEKVSVETTSSTPENNGRTHQYTPKYIMGLTNLTSLHLGGTQFSDVRRLRVFVQLKCLSINIKDENMTTALEKVKALQNLESLGLGGEISTNSINDCQTFFSKLGKNVKVYKVEPINFI